MVEFEEEEDANDIHEGRVELEVDLGGAYVVASAQNSFHYEGQAEGKEYAVLFWNALLSLLDYSRTSTISSLFVFRIQSLQLPEMFLVKGKSGTRMHNNLIITKVLYTHYLMTVHPDKA